jgi:uncharacterized Zn-finger protein
MKHAAEPEVFAGPSTFEKTCVYCGARFRVLANQSRDANRPRSYECPGCGKSYEIEAKAPPSVHLLRGRTDGKNDRYQETMF